MCLTIINFYIFIKIILPFSDKDCKEIAELLDLVKELSGAIILIFLSIKNLIKSGNFL